MQGAHSGLKGIRPRDAQGRGEDLLVVAVEGAEVNVFREKSVLVESVELSPAFGLSDMEPVCGAVARAGEPTGLDERVYVLSFHP